MMCKNGVCDLNMFDFCRCNTKKRAETIKSKHMKRLKEKPLSQAIKEWAKLVKDD